MPATIKKSYFFPHDYNARNDPKMVNLLMKHGITGHGIFWAIIEMLFEQGGYLNISDYERIAFELRTDNETIKSIVENTELFQIKDEMFFSKSVLRRIKIIKSKSDKAKNSVSKRWEKQRLMKDTNVLQPYNDSNTIKEKKRKEIKVKENTNEEFEKFWELYGRHGNKKNAIKSFNRLTKTELELLKEKLPAYIKSTPDIQYRKHFATYLNGECWNDEIITRSNGQQKEPEVKMFSPYANDR